MLTEKAISDYVWCPTLLREPEGKLKRFKDDRRHGDDSMELIHAGLTTGASNKKVIISKVEGGLRAEAYDKDMWMCLTAGDTQILITLTEASLVKEPAGPWRVTAIRHQHRKAPRADDQIRGEEMVRVIVASSLKVYFTRLSVTVRTVYDGIYEGPPEAHTTIDPSLVKIAEAEAFFREIEDVYQGDIQRPSKLDRCQYCWWKKGCPKAEVVDIKPELPQVGRTTINIL